VQNNKKAHYGKVIDPNTREESNLWQNIAENSITKNGPVNPFSDITLPIGFPVSSEKGTINKDLPGQDYFRELGNLKYYPRELNKKYNVTFPLKYNTVKYDGYKLVEKLTVSAGWANLNKLKKFIQNDCQPYFDDDGILEFYLSDKGTIYYKKKKDSSRNIVSVLRNFTTTEKMKYSLEAMGLNFTYPKPKDLIEYIINIGDGNIYLDYFAGSGTTAHAIINLNRNQDFRKKYILVEMGKHFESVILPRIKQVTFSDNWKDSKPQDKNGISQIFKYFKLESYEDTLNNLVFNQSEKQKKLLNNKATVNEDYFLNYMLDYETSESQLVLDNFAKPFDYKLYIATDSAGETKEATIDLVETFNYLIGLKVEERKAEKGYLWLRGENLKGDKILIIWRDFENLEIPLEDFVKAKRWDIEKRDDIDFDIVFINGDNNLNNIKKDENLKVRLIEEEFKLRMFGK
jgi:adenine-specific DNA-methyltransferase